jgi:hypothetical protein
MRFRAHVAALAASIPGHCFSTSCRSGRNPQISTSYAADCNQILTKLQLTPNYN